MSDLQVQQQEEIKCQRRYSDKMAIFLSYCCNDCTGIFVRALVPFECMICHKHTIPWTPFDAEILRERDGYSQDVKLC